ncbi:DUF4147 domain-containing protein [Sulfurimonas aquatica]|uniref:DUF4147 domain-containing protein n=1 Tax=Sulfurimonas aquatica TaxID=2672570 RepID=A0A975B1T9_9BACT|nr:DUF4147 domain-containing protein [Sulfurimonas aquatica]QSZ42676.1 DUF4147 domain-containing protein [Sulfurimonas aquatica]
MSKELAREIFSSALEEALPKNFMQKHCRLDENILTLKESRYDLSRYKNLYVFGSGKAAHTMAVEIENILLKRIYKGLVIAPDEGDLKKIELRVGSHPIPSKKSIESTKALVEMMQECDEDDLYIFLLSGGSSALMELPLDSISLEELQSTTSLMLSHNLEIHEINAVRKHLSQIKGGRLSHLCRAQGAVLVVSDIIDNALDSIGSAPLYCDESSFGDVKNILDSKEIFSKMPLSVQKSILKGMRGEIDESPFFPLRRVEHIILSSNSQAVDRAVGYAISLGISVEKVIEPMEGEVTLMVKKMLQTAKESPQKCLIFGGECTVALDGDGMGGRNQHATLLMLKEIKEQDLEITFLSASTDGIDGNSDAAGAVVDSSSYSYMLSIDEYIKNFDSYNYLKSENSLIMTGPSGTNVIDIALIIKGD